MEALAEFRHGAFTELEHYNAYLVATNREDRRYQELAHRLQRKGAG